MAGEPTGFPIDPRIAPMFAAGEGPDWPSDRERAHDR
jgi:hypothetical protein